MKTAIDIVKNIVFPQLEKDSKFTEQQVDSVFWEKLTTCLLHFEEDAKPIYTHIYSLELDNPEKIIDKLPNIYSQYIKELAESYVLGSTSDATDYLLKTNNEAFFKEVQFLQTMQKAIKSVERKRIKDNFPKAYDRLTFELSETDISLATKKKGREDLREKFKQWDAELSEDDVPVIVMENEKHQKKIKVISLSWMKYAAAACVIITAGIFYFKSTDNDIVPNQNSVVTTPINKESKEGNQKTKITPARNEAFAVVEIVTTSKSVSVLEPSSLGYTANDKKPKVTIHFKDATQRILSLEKILKTNKEKLTIDSKILNQYKIELVQLKAESENYLFDGKALTLFERSTKDCKILSTEEQHYYLKKEAVYYELKISSNPLPLKRVTDDTIIESLEKISFDNE